MDFLADALVQIRSVAIRFSRIGNDACRALLRAGEMTPDFKIRELVLDGNKRIDAEGLLCLIALLKLSPRTAQVDMRLSSLCQAGVDNVMGKLDVDSS